jgi:hypothetical protein
MSICFNCGAENFNVSLHCTVCGEPLTPEMSSMDEDNTEQIKEFKYQTDYSYFRAKLYPVFFLMTTLLMNWWIFSLFPPVLGIYLMVIPFDFLMLGGIFVAWQMFPEIEVDDNSFRLTTPLGTYIVRYDAITVDVKSLSLAHRIVGLTFGSGGKPSFLIRTDISNYKVLYNILVSKSGAKPEKYIL